MFKILVLLLLVGCFKSFPITEEQSTTEVEITPFITVMAPTVKASLVPAKATENLSIGQSKNNTKMSNFPQTTQYNLPQKVENITEIEVLTVPSNNLNKKHNLKIRSVEKDKLQIATEVSEPCCGRANDNNFNDEGSQKEDRNCCGRLKPDNQAAFNEQPEDDEECCGRVEQNQQLPPVQPVKAKRSVGSYEKSDPDEKTEKNCAKHSKNFKTRRTAVEPKVNCGHVDNINQCGASPHATVECCKHADSPLDTSSASEEKEEECCGRSEDQKSEVVYPTDATISFSETPQIKFTEGSDSGTTEINSINRLMRMPHNEFVFIQLNQF